MPKRKESSKNLTQMMFRVVLLVENENNEVEEFAIKEISFL